MERIEAVLFDFGGTLDGEGLHWQTRFRRAFEIAGFPQAAERFAAAYREAEARLARDQDLSAFGYREMIEAQVGQQVHALGLDPDAVVPEVVRLCYDAAVRCVERNRRLLSELRAMGLELGVVSNFPGNLEIVCRELGLAAWLDTLVDSTVEKVAKPDPRIFTLAAERLGRAPGRCLVVGDSLERDILPARSAGFRTAWILEPDAATPREAPADHVLRELREVLAIAGKRPSGERRERT
jgi:putative hydrolase of the HAD superfamily